MKKHIHFIGVKGVGMAPLAIIAKEAGYTVSGCDIDQEFITDTTLKKSDITPSIGFSTEHLTDVDMVITTGAHGGFDNPEVKEAKNRGLSVLTQGEAVGLFMDGGILHKKGLIGVSVAGTHGKTTTTAMIATILKYCGADPSFIVGTSDIPSLGNAGHFGRGKYYLFFIQPFRQLHRFFMHLALRPALQDEKLDVGLRSPGRLQLDGEFHIHRGFVVLFQLFEDATHALSQRRGTQCHIQA